MIPEKCSLLLGSGQTCFGNDEYPTRRCLRMKELANKAARVIEGVHVVPMGMANAFLVEGEDRLTLIDAGYPAKKAAVFAAIRALGRSPDQLKHLILTQSHPDHIGSAAQSCAKPARGGPICTHSIFH
jgi:glyoxylase-like metal-dependent hydrolase (beta-lactamase superfamily II)